MLLTLSSRLLTLLACGVSHRYFIGTRAKLQAVCTIGIFTTVNPYYEAVSLAKQLAEPDQAQSNVCQRRN